MATKKATSSGKPAVSKTSTPKKAAPRKRTTAKATTADDPALTVEERESLDNAASNANLM